MLRAAVSLSFCSLLTACSVPTEPSDADQLADARERWDRLGLSNYDYDVRWDCFCLGPVGRWIEVSVRGNVVIRGRYADTGEDVELRLSPELPTIPDLFDQVESIIAGDPDRLDVRYDPDNGHLILLMVDRIHNAVDDEYSLQSRNLQGQPVLLERAR